MTDHVTFAPTSIKPRKPRAVARIAVNTSYGRNDLLNRISTAVVKSENWRPNNPTITCPDLPCDPPDPRDRTPMTKHAHYAVRMLVPLSVGAYVSMGRGDRKVTW